MTTPGTQLAFSCGDIVRQREGRHYARVIAQFLWIVRVQWIANGWKEDLDLSDVVLVERNGRRYE